MNNDPDLYEVIDKTWPAASMTISGPFTLREGRGGGSRVSSATANGPATPVDLEDAAQAMRALNQKPIFMIRDGDEDLDAQLDALGYEILDPVVIYSCPTRQLTDIPIPRVTAFTIWEPLEIMREIWVQGGIGPARMAVMERTKGPKTGILARHRDKPAGTGFAAVHNGTAMVHAVEILPHQRRQGVGGWIMRCAAYWALDQGAEGFSVICTRANVGANALYASLGMKVVGQYHYRHLPAETQHR